MSDELVTHAEVMRWLPTDVQRELEMSLPPEQRGWYTEAEMQASDGVFVYGISMSEPGGPVLPD